MAKQSVPADSPSPKVQLANDVHWVASEWKENPIPEFIKYHLHRVDRCVLGAIGISTLLHRFAMGMEDVVSTGDDDLLRVVYPTLDSNEADRLRVGLSELLGSAEESLEYLRSDRGGHVTAAMKERGRG